MKAPAVGYARPASVADAVELLAEHGDEAKVLAGGQSLLPLLHMRLAVPSLLVDVSGLDELRATSVTEAGATRYGAGVVHSDVEDGCVPDRSAGLMRATAAGIGYRAIRNRGTLGGSVAHSDASAEWPVVLAALGATAVARSARRERTVPCAGFVEGYLSNVLDDDELLVAVDVPPAGDRFRWGLQKSARKPGEFAESLAVAVADLDADGAVAGAEVWLGAASDVPLRLPDVAAALIGRRPDEVDGGELAALVEQAAGAGADADGEYAGHLHGVTVARAVAQLAEEDDR